MASSTRLLVVDDDVELCAMLFEYFAAEGFVVTLAHTGSNGAELIKSGNFDLAILDVMLPGQGGINVLREVRRSCRTPVIMLTARGEPANRIVGLELGADDYLAKPFDPRELLARINAVLRRAYPVEGAVEIRTKDLVISPGSRTVVVGLSPIPLTSVEFDLLTVLAKQTGQVVTRDELSAALGRRLLPFDRSIDMHIVNLRRKLGPAPDGSPRILTIRATGYMLSAGGVP